MESQPQPEAMSPADVELKKRRERARTAQSAFRHRQKQARLDKEAETDRLRDAIRSILKETSADDRPELRTLVLEAAAVAGISTNPRTFLDRRPEATAAQGSTPPDDALTQVLKPNNRKVNRFSDCDGSIRLDPFQCHTCDAGVAAVLPFVGAGAFSFPGRVFWHIVEKHEAEAQRGITPTHDTLMDPPSDLVLRDCGTTPGHGRPPSRRGLLDEVESSSAINPEPLSLRQKIKMRVAYYTWRTSNGQPSTPVVQSPRDEAAGRNSLTLMAIEKRFRAAVGDDVFTLLAAPVIDRWERTKKWQVDWDPTEPLDLFLDMLASNFVCRGDGPHWDVGQFDSALVRWCYSVIDSSGVQTSNYPLIK